jgi:hypothetical protein
MGDGGGGVRCAWCARLLMIQPASFGAAVLLCVSSRSKRFEGRSEAAIFYAIFLDFYSLAPLRSLP